MTPPLNEDDLRAVERLASRSVPERGDSPVLPQVMRETLLELVAYYRAAGSGPDRETVVGLATFLRDNPGATLEAKASVAVTGSKVSTHNLQRPVPKKYT